MTQFPAAPTALRLSLPETTFLEPHHIDQAQALSESVDRKGANELSQNELSQNELSQNELSQNELCQWQTYIQALALLGFSQWLGQRFGGGFDADQVAVWQSHAMVQLGEFKLCLIAAEHVLDEFVSVPEMAIAFTAAHFYLLIEVVEEQARVILRGLMRHDQLMQYIQQYRIPATTEGYYELPLEQFDTEPNHLLHYYQYLRPEDLLQPEAIEVPVSQGQLQPQALPQPQVQPQVQPTPLAHWLQNIVVEGWQAIDAMLDPTLGLEFSTRNPELGAARGKLIDIEMQMGSQTLALIVNITQEPVGKFGVLVQLHPTGGERYLPGNLKLILLSKAGQVLQEVQARSQDNYIQLRPFKGEQGKCFSLKVSLANVNLTEDFVL